MSKSYILKLVKNNKEYKIDLNKYDNSSIRVFLGRTFKIGFKDIDAPIVKWIHDGKIIYDETTAVIYGDDNAFEVINIDINKWTPEQRENNSLRIEDNEINIFNLVTQLSMIVPFNNMTTIKLEDYYNFLKDWYLLRSSDKIIHLTKGYDNVSVWLQEKSVEYFIELGIFNIGVK